MAIEGTCPGKAVTPVSCHAGGRQPVRDRLEISSEAPTLLFRVRYRGVPKIALSRNKPRIDGRPVLHRCQAVHAFSKRSCSLVYFHPSALRVGTGKTFCLPFSRMLVSSQSNAGISENIIPKWAAKTTLYTCERELRSPSSSSSTELVKEG